jgi:DNA-binding NarL/FixJ family response regulator
MPREMRHSLSAARSGPDLILRQRADRGTLDAGAVGYLLKGRAPRRRGRGRAGGEPRRVTHDPKAARGLLSTRFAATGTVGASSLTTQEAEVLRRVRGGLPNKQIAQRLGIAERTVSPI